ncbi:uncharacterized protein LOC133888130 [Phragmites australis]|uniref:uncharacterized protein LOC133888130 n=1 Tax=Phragmites australis TaxID=29695 RepID=UPI002D76FA2F|nr:uncharacterized protein LOC133888130 [Phragmites australis]
MAAHSCCGVASSAAPATRRVKLRRPSAASKATKTKKTAAKPVTSRKRVVIRRKMEALRRLVPICGDDSNGARERADDRLDELLLHAAGYIRRLQMQVRMMQVMVHALNNPED